LRDMPTIYEKEAEIAWSMVINPIYRWLIPLPRNCSYLMFNKILPVQRLLIQLNELVKTSQAIMIGHGMKLLKKVPKSKRKKIYYILPFHSYMHQSPRMKTIFSHGAVGDFGRFSPCYLHCYYLIGSSKKPVR